MLTEASLLNKETNHEAKTFDADTVSIPGASNFSTLDVI
jgi:hypothetical protein